MVQEAGWRAVACWGANEDRVRDSEESALIHLDALYRAVLYLSHNQTEAEDLVQERCLRALRNFHRFDPGSNCRAWLLMILKNVFLNRQRQARERLRLRTDRETAFEDAARPNASAHGTTALACPPDNPEEELFQTVLHGDMDRALKSLPLVFREVIVLADLGGFSYREISEALGCPVGTVMSCLSRGRKGLRQALGQYARDRGYVKEQE